MLEKLFKLSQFGTTPKTEVIAGFTTYLTMAYIIFVNPAILADAGMDKGAVFVATCIAAAIGCFIMGFWANLPVALAPGMGLNAFFTYGVVLGMGHDWQTALGAVFFSGVLFIILSVLRIREMIINAIPSALKLAIAAGIGAFLALIALKSAGIIVDHPATLVTLGEINEFKPAIALAGFFAIIALVQRNVPGAVMLVILAVSAIGIAVGDVEYAGIMSMPPSMAPTFMQMDLAAALDVAMISVIFAFLFVDLFDTSGTLIAVTQRAGLTTSDGKVPRLRQALMADSSATIAGAALGTSTTTSYIESASGVAAGGRTGLTAITVGLLFLVSIFFAPLAGMIPAYATAGAILYVSVLMMFSLKDVNWEDLTESAPVVVVLLLTPLTFSIAHGITLGFITYAAAKLLGNKREDVTVSVWIISALLLLKVIFIG
ncbi:NCS2 family permease [Bermanella marisrubri]|uniref:Guanine-hypoxanthine permease n=1 Tax=Bermanella marisrubri TaxID=207949 RepID=Q1MZE1_9GAMM|nr:NCS2 family permease [Bermanella marisrubri]EAT11325.1 guanine-hypoxanthine permease [Oceanobacter sp. RED65] [Bermanella marisrubri]QIZ85288.1 NCS2 family permease [Bermanella marisrubri]